MKTHKREIALFVAFAFIALLQFSAMPLRADQSPDRAMASTPDQGPRFIEEEGNGAAAPKKSIVPIVLIGVGVIALAAVLVLVVFKTQYDITGAWDYKWRNTGDSSWTTQLIEFTGSKSSGTVKYTYGSNSVSGTYTVDAKKLTYSWTYTTGTKVSASGEFQTKDKVTGTWSTQYGASGDWELTRKAAATTGLFSGAATGLDR